MARNVSLKLPRFYTLALALAAVLGPFIWLVFTPDGQRHSDLFVLWLLGDPSFNIAYDKLTDQVTEPLVRAQFPRVRFQCQTAPAPAEAAEARWCVAAIASFNGLPARAARLYFVDERLRLLQLDYRPRYRDLLERSLRAGLGEPREETTGAEPVLIWQRPGGRIFLPAVATATERDAALIWLAGSAE